MADAKKCDRCGKLFEPYIKSDERLNPNQYTEIMVRDVLLVSGEKVAKAAIIDEQQSTT